MASYNRTILMGNVTKDLVVRDAGGTSVTTVRLAVNERFKRKGKEERTLFIDCEVWGKQCDVVAQYVKKGDPLLVEGVLTPDQYEKDGQTVYKTYLNVDNVQLMPRGGGTEETPETANESTPAPEGDDIPF